MPQITLAIDLQEIKELVLQLPLNDLQALLDAIEDRVESSSMMGLAETSFAEGNEEGEDIYDAET